MAEAVIGADGRGSRHRALLATFSALLRRVQGLHDRGFVHGDLQPDHFLVDASGAVYLLDLALVKRVRGDDFAYRGGLVHFNSPEVCAALLAGSADVPLDPLAEVYSAAAVLFYLYTGHLAADYGRDDYRTLPLADMLGRIAAGHRRAFSAVATEPFPKLERALDWCLQVDRARRCPSLARAIADLKRVAP